MSVDERSVVAIFGGKGFVGRYLVRRLARTGAKIVVVSRSSRIDSEMKLQCAIGQLTFQKLPLAVEDLEKLFVGVTHVVNLMGVSIEKDRNTFQTVHCTLPEKIAKFATKAKCERFVHVSALFGVSCDSRYGASKIAGEGAVKKFFPKATILRPSLIFGPEDRSLNLFATMIKYLPVLPLFADCKLQPVYVGDVAEVIAKCLEVDAHLVCEKDFAVAGKRQYTLRKLFEYLALVLKKRRMFLLLPSSFSLIFAYFLQILPIKLLTVDQLKSLRSGSTATEEESARLRSLGIKVKSLHIMEKYLS